MSAHTNVHEKKSPVQKKMLIGKKLKDTANILMNDLKAIGKGTTKLAGDTVDQVHKNTKELLQRADKKLS